MLQKLIFLLLFPSFSFHPTLLSLSLSITHTNSLSLTHSHSLSLSLTLTLILTAKRFKADTEHELGGAGGSGSGMARGSGMPVQFEKAPAVSSKLKAKKDEFSSFFGGNSGLTSRKTLEGVGTKRGGSMMASAGASSRDELVARGGSGRTISFTKSSSSK